MFCVQTTNPYRSNDVFKNPQDGIEKKNNNVKMKFSVLYFFVIDKYAFNHPF